MSRTLLTGSGRTSTAIVGTVAAAWGALIVWTNSPYSAFLGHGELGDVASLAQLLPLALIFLAGWTLMLFAMMIPAATPFLTQLRMRSDRRGDLLASVCGYLAVWVLFGLAAYSSDLGIHRLAETPLLQGHTWVLGTSALVLASGYQFTPSKGRLLNDCCYPSDFINSHWRPQGGRLSMLRLGLGYGTSSVGSGWAVMLLMFALGLGNVLWMVAFTSVMVTESLSRWGPKLRVPLGVVLAGVAAFSFFLALGI